MNSPVVIHLSDDVDVNRGNYIMPIDALPKTGKEISATICWMNNTPYIPGQKLVL